MFIKHARCQTFFMPMKRGYLLWVPIGIYEFVCVCVDGCLWVPMDVYGFSRVYGYYIYTIKICLIFSFKNHRGVENPRKRLK